MSKNIDRVGETNVANNGMKMEIITYRGVNDIDIQFEDGTIVNNAKYNTFKNGTIKNPNAPKSNLKSMVGETNVSKNGQKMTIIEYRNANDIDIQFEDGTIVKSKPYISFKRGMIKLPNEQKEQVAIMLDKEAKELLHNYSKVVGKSASEVINNLIKLNCVDFNHINNNIFGTYGNNLSYLKNFDYKFLSKMSKEEFIGRYVNSILGEMKNSIYHCIAPKCKNVNYDKARILYFRPYNGYIRYIKDTTSMLLDLFDESIETFEDIVIALYGIDSDEHYIVQIYNKFLEESNNDDAECWKHMCDYGVYIDDYTKKNPNGTYYTRIGSIMDILSYQGRESEYEEIQKTKRKDF
jgi:hypothetical protein